MIDNYSIFFKKQIVADLMLPKWGNIAPVDHIDGGGQPDVCVLMISDVSPPGHAITNVIVATQPGA